MRNKNIIVGVTAGIAAYKTAYLVRLLVKNKANVKVIMSPLSKKFITPLTMATLSKNPVLIDFFNPKNGEWNSHVDLGIWADAMIIAPATANTIAKMANGICDNLLLTTYLSARCPIFIAPTMDLDMYKHKTTQENIEKLRKLNVNIIEPETGELASGLEGKGRMEEPDKIVEYMKYKLTSKQQKLKNKKILVTAGPTQEDIDPVRFISNHSSGLMGYSIAQSLAEKGAEVILISGKVKEEITHPDIRKINVTNAQEMYDAAIVEFPRCDVAVMSAAVADYTPEKKSKSKLKKKGDRLIIELIATKDIAASLGAIKQKKQLIVGFALETDNEKENALKKIKSKKLDFIVLNSLRDKGAGFGTKTNKITIIEKNGTEKEYPLKDKKEVAEDIVEKLIEKLH